MVLDEADDLELAPVGEAEMDHVGLPALVRQACLEPDAGGLWSLLRLGVTKPPALEHPPDRVQFLLCASCAGQPVNGGHPVGEHLRWKSS